MTVLDCVLEAENNLCMAQVGGDVVPEGSTFQGWPAEMLFQKPHESNSKCQSEDVCIEIGPDEDKKPL